MNQHLCKGFKASGIVSGIKKGNRKDLGLIFSEVPATVAGVFTRNQVQAAPVLLDKQRVKSRIAQAVIVNAGNANCCTGSQGMTHAIAMGQCVADQLQLEETSVLVASTGVIGEPLPIEKITAAAPELVKSLAADGFVDLAQAIMTTDTVPKLISRQGNIDGQPFTVLGVAKGSGMIHPDMATMLCFVCTDAQVAPEVLQNALLTATDRSFHCITVDGDTSTNDTVLLMANGQSGVSVSEEADKEHFQNVLDDVMIQLAKMIVKDAEGATKLVQICVSGAQTEIDAKDIAETIALSKLVKTAFFGEDANWGRILAAAGRTGVPLDPGKIDVYVNDVALVKNSMGLGKEAEARATEILKRPEFTIKVDLNMGDGQATILTSDLSLDYVRINADYRS